MLCESCGTKKIWEVEGSTQGWKCPACGLFGPVTTYIDEIYTDSTDYEIIIESESIDTEKIKCISKIAGVNFLTAKSILEKGNTCILKAKAPEIKKAIEKLIQSGISYKISPSYKY